MEIAIEKIRPADLEFALALSTAAGWNQTGADWRRWLELSPGGCFLARADGRPAGTVTTIMHGGTRAWIGMVLVHPELRRRGVATGLLHHALAKLSAQGIRSVWLDATPEGQPVYEQSGFVVAESLDRWEGEWTAPAPDRRPDAYDWDELLALDGEAFGVSRGSLLTALRDDALTVSARPNGFIFTRAGRAAVYCGPWVAQTPSSAAWLLDFALAHCPTGRVCVDAPRRPATAAILSTRGLAVTRSLVRMRKGPAGPSGRPEWIYGIAGPEVG